PLGLYSVTGKGQQPSAVVMVPIADEKEFVDALTMKLNLKPQKGTDGLYTIKLENGPPGVQEAYFRISNRHAYATAINAATIDKKALLAPKQVLTGGQGLMTITLHLDQVPEEIKTAFLDGFKQGLEQAKQQAPAPESKAQEALRDAMFAEMTAAVKS